jgi:hypothetical protein
MKPRKQHLYRTDPGWVWERIVAASLDRVVVYNGAAAREAGLLRGTSDPWVIAYYAIERGDPPPKTPVECVGAFGEKQACAIAGKIASGQATLIDYGGQHVPNGFVPEAPALVIVDPKRAGEALSASLDAAVSVHEVAQTMRSMLQATKVMLTKDGEQHEFPDWAARHKAMMYYAEYLIGRPAQRIEHQAVTAPEETDPSWLSDPATLRALLETAKDVNPDVFHSVIASVGRNAQNSAASAGETNSA